MDNPTPDTAGVAENRPQDAKKTVKKRVGRPRKTDIAKKKPGGRGKVGRPKGDAAIINEYKARMLNSPRSRQVLDKILEAALNDEHKHQAAAWKLVMDRIAPVSGFDRDAGKAGSGGIQISITTVGGSTEVVGQEDPVDAEWTEVKNVED